MYCGACGRENSIENKFCGGCGKPLELAIRTQPDEKEESAALTSKPDNAVNPLEQEKATKQRLIYFESAGKEEQAAALGLTALICGWLATYKWAWELGGGLLGFGFVIGFLGFAGWHEQMNRQRHNQTPTVFSIGLCLGRFVLAVLLWTFGTQLFFAFFDAFPDAPYDFGKLIAVVVYAVQFSPKLLLAFGLVCLALVLCGAWGYFRKLCGRDVSCPICNTLRFVRHETVSFTCDGCKQRILVKGGELVRLA